MHCCKSITVLTTFIVLILPAFAVLAVPGEAAQRPGVEKKPNVIMIFCDDLGYGDISSFADTPHPVRTTNIDRLAEQGMKFTQFYVASPVCSPSRAAVLSGMFASETGLTNFLHTKKHNRDHDQNDWMDPSIAYLPKAFKNAGYATAHIGKWHVGGGRDVDNAPSITKYGYDEYITTNEGPDPDPKLGVNEPWLKIPEPEKLPDHQRTGYKVDKTLDFLRRHNEQPCFVTLWTNDVHATYHPSKEMQEKHGGTDKPTKTWENFLGVLEEYDREIGRLLDELKNMGLEENTIVFFTGDNGAGPMPNRRSNGLRGHKLTLYEGGIREPFIIRWPKKIEPGTENHDTVLCAVDLLPTLTSLAGIPMSEEAKQTCDGEDLSAAMLGEPPERTKPIYWENLKDRPADHPRGPSLAIRKDNWKLLVNHDGSDVELYDIAVDPKETTNVADKHPELAKELSAEVIKWSKTLPHRTHECTCGGRGRYVSNEHVRSKPGLGMLNGQPRGRRCTLA